jgi:hypothetical protein
MIALDYALTDGNAPPDVTKARDQGVRMAIMRAAWGYHGHAHADPVITRDAPRWRAAGVQVGAYLFLDYETDPRVQADVCATAYRRAADDLPVALDLELDTPPPGTTPRSRLDAALVALERLQQHYGSRGVWVYTSLQQWLDHFGDLDAPALGACPLWLKTPYYWKARRPPDVHNVGPLGELPRPWKAHGSAGAWAQQFQGDALGWSGFSSTVDLSTFLPAQAGDPRWSWVVSRFFSKAPNLPAWQSTHGLAADGIVGPRTFAALCQ